MRAISGTQSATAHSAAASLNAAYGRAEIPAVLAGVTVAPRVAEAPKVRATRNTQGGAARAAKVVELHRCRCSELVLEDGSWTGCEAMVKGTFAPGHDAKAASLVVRAAKLGEENRAQYAAEELGEENGRVFDEAAQVWRNPAEVFAGTKLGQKVAAKLGQAEAVARQAAATFSHATGASAAAERDSLDAELVGA